eukprot:TRINITY_DN1429_c0_g1_i2.p1 TRINITY_DN1429_c0_g1~~TRINITY_DN1429_c0_g1_i2.p1  ORF type:complete len:377 (-),score=73.74 TRINITY_DN1429_c0_g1_i2:602-1732(-)
MSNCGQCYAHLHILNGLDLKPGVPPLIHINKDVLTFGRNKKAVDVYIDSKLKSMISREHAKLERVENTDAEFQWRLSDLKSANGLFINSIKTPEAVLRDGDEITFGGGGGIKNGLELQSISSELVYVFRAANITQTKKRKSSELEEQTNEVSCKVIDIEAEEAEAKEAEKNPKRKKNEQEDDLNKLSVEEASKQKKLIEELEKQKNDLTVLLHKNECESKQKLEDQMKKVQQLQTVVDQRSDIEEEFTCPICFDLMVIPHTLHCAHSFCYLCLSHWLHQHKEKKECPVCRASAAKESVKSKSLENAIDKITKTRPQAVQEEYQKRKQSAQKKLEEIDSVRSLEQLILRARQQNLKFLSISDLWTPEERNNFMSGVA